MQHRGKRLKSFKSQKEHYETGIETEKYAQLELLRVIDGTISIPLSIQKAIPESESFTPELARTNKNQTYERQADYLQSLFTDGLIIKDIGSGLNYKRKGLLSLLGQVLSGNVREVVVCHFDRLVRFGFDLIEWFCQQLALPTRGSQPK